jgi:hypothetical protein
MLSWDMGGSWSSRESCFPEQQSMARWPRSVRTTIFTYATVFVLFPALCWLAYAYVQGWLF